MNKWRPSMGAWYNGSASDLPTRKNYGAIDVCKFAFAFLVVIIHISPFSSFDSDVLKSASFVLQNGICRIADPFYFVAAGFLLFRKIDLQNVDSEEIVKYVFKILRLYGLWSILLLLGGNGQLWFLGGLAVAVLILFAFIKCRLSLSVIGIISLVMYVVGILDVSFGPALAEFIPSTIESLYHSVNGTFRLGLIMGVPYVFMGLLFATKQIVLRKITVEIGCVLSFFLLIGEACVLKRFVIPNDYYQLVMLYPFSFFFFYFVTHAQVKERTIYKRLRVIGMIIFYSHLFINSVVKLCFALLSKIGGVIEILASNSLVQFMLTIVFSIAAGTLIERLSRKERYAFLRYLYS